MFPGSHIAQPLDVDYAATAEEDTSGGGGLLQAAYGYALLHLPEQEGRGQPPVYSPLGGTGHCYGGFTTTRNLLMDRALEIWEKKRMQVVLAGCALLLLIGTVINRSSPSPAEQSPYQSFTSLPWKQQHRHFEDQCHHDWSHYEQRCGKKPQYPPLPNAKELMDERMRKCHHCLIHGIVVVNKTSGGHFQHNTIPSLIHEQTSCAELEHVACTHLAQCQEDCRVKPVDDGRSTRRSSFIRDYHDEESTEIMPFLNCLVEHRHHFWDGGEHQEHQEEKYEHHRPHHHPGKSNKKGIGQCPKIRSCNLGRNEDDAQP